MGLAQTRLAGGNGLNDPTNRRPFLNSSPVLLSTIYYLAQRRSSDISQRAGE